MIEADLMLLEEYLDGELSASDARALEERSFREPELAKELQRLRGDRQIRAQAWRAMEGDEAAVAAVARGISAGIQRRESFAFLFRGLRIGAAAAACIVIGLTVGFFARSSNPWHTTVSAAPGNSADSDKIVMTSRLASDALPPEGSDVQIKDAAGKVVAVQHFGSIEQARQFVQDVGQWQQHQEQMHNGNVTLVADQY